MADKLFPTDFTLRTPPKTTDKLIIHNIDTGVTQYTTVAEIIALVTKVFLGLENVDNTADADKNVSYADTAGDAGTLQSYAASHFEVANANIQAHISNNSQAHSDYLKNNANDESSGTITASDFILA